jgi:hypothetical protein
LAAASGSDSSGKRKYRKKNVIPLSEYGSPVIPLVKIEIKEIIDFTMLA